MDEQKFLQLLIEQKKIISANEQRKINLVKNSLLTEKKTMIRSLLYLKLKKISTVFKVDVQGVSFFFLLKLDYKKNRQKIVIMGREYVEKNYLFPSS